MSTFWNNGKMNMSWEAEKYLRKLKVDPKDFEHYDDIVSYLFNMELDHMHKGKLDDTGLDIVSCINELKRINE